MYAHLEYDPAPGFRHIFLPWYSTWKFKPRQVNYSPGANNKDSMAENSGPRSQPPPG